MENDDDVPDGLNRTTSYQLTVSKTKTDGNTSAPRREGSGTDSLCAPEIVATSKVADPVMAENNVTAKSKTSEKNKTAKSKNTVVSSRNGSKSSTASKSVSKSSKSGRQFVNPDKIEYDQQFGIRLDMSLDKQQEIENLIRAVPVANFASNSSFDESKPFSFSYQVEMEDPPPKLLKQKYQR